MAELRIVVEPDPFRPERIQIVAVDADGHIDMLAPGVAKTKVDIESAWIHMFEEQLRDWAVRNGVRQH